MASPSSSSSSSTHNIPPHHLLHHYAGPTSAPPPTPSTHPISTTGAAADTLTRLLHRLPPTLSFPTRRLSSPPLPTSLTPSSLQLGYFQLSPNDHHISPQLANSAESEAASLFNSPTLQTHTLFPNNCDWPLGLHDNDDDDDDYTTSFCLDAVRTTTELASLTELTRELEKVGLNVANKLACMMGFDSPFGETGSGSSPLMWVSLLEADKTGRVYPYVVGLQYQISARKWKLASDVGSVEVEPEVGSILVTFGDIAQVWSNGKLNKIRGRPTGVLEDRARSSGSHCISMTMLLTLPLESTVSPLLSLPAKIEEKDVLEPVKDCEQGNDNQSVKASFESRAEDAEDWRVFNSFSFEDYAWRVYHERLHLKDTLDRYRRLLD